jgi:hypothetical protein
VELLKKKKNSQPTIEEIESDPERPDSPDDIKNKQEKSFIVLCTRKSLHHKLSTLWQHGYVKDALLSQKGVELIEQSKYRLFKTN